MHNDNDGGEVILDAFRNLRIDYVISSPGSEWPAVWEALARQKRDQRDGPTYVDCAHEVLAVSLAAGYTAVTGRMQAVLLHAGAGLLQGAMAVAGARAMELPMLVLSGEARDYGETAFDPGSQWYRNLSVVGGPGRLIEPVVKWAQPVPGPATLYQSLLRAGEMAQRQPRGPTYLSLSMETMMAPAVMPKQARPVAPAPLQRPLDADIDRVAAMIAAAKQPVIITENAGSDPAAFEALIALAERAAIPVVDAQGSFFGNFPSTHPLYQGGDLDRLIDGMDLALLVECRAPWYPPSRIPPQAEVVAIADSPHKAHMVYQVTGAGHYLEGDAATTLRLLDAALARQMPPADQVAARQQHWAEAHRQRRQAIAARETQALAAPTPSIPLLMRSLRERMPADTIYVDESIVHAGLIRSHVDWQDARTFFRAPSGLGQGLGYALGIRMALPERLLVMTIGDGTFLYNPVLPALAFAARHRLPLLIVIVNNRRYASMQKFHDLFYPAGAASGGDDYYGVHLDDTDYARVVDSVGGHGERVETAAALGPAIDAALAAIQAGRSAIIDLILP